jgi:hypothetical protein
MKEREDCEVDFFERHPATAKLNKCRRRMPFRKYLREKRIFMSRKDLSRERSRKRVAVLFVMLLLVVELNIISKWVR